MDLNPSWLPVIVIIINDIYIAQVRKSPRNCEMGPQMCW